MVSDMYTRPLNIILIEDNAGDAVLIEEMLKESNSTGFEIQVFDRLILGRRAMASNIFDAVLLDLNLPDSFGLETLTDIQTLEDQIAVIVLTGLDDEETAIEALRKGAQDYLVKDQLTPDLLVRSIHYSIERKLIEQALLKREKELKVKTRDLEEVNAALRVLLKKRAEDKKELEERMVSNAKELIEPFLKKLKGSGLNRRQQSYVDILELNLKDIISPLVHGMSLSMLKLTPSEIQIANLVRYGKTTKEIAQLLNLSARTIEVHRNKIRQKINITNKKINLRTYLQTLP